MFRRPFRLIQQARYGSLCRLLGEFDRGEFRVRLQEFRRDLPDCGHRGKGLERLAFGQLKVCQAKPGPLISSNQAEVRGEILFLRPLVFRHADRLRRAVYAIRIAEVRWRGPSCTPAQHLPSGCARIACRQGNDAPRRNPDTDERPDKPGAPPDPGIGVQVLNKASALSESRSATWRYCSAAP